MMHRLAAWLGAMSCILSPVAAFAQEKSASRPGFAMAPGACILLFRPDISVGAQSTGGIAEPNADWTQEAREHLDAALGRAQQGMGHPIVTAAAPVGEAAAALAAYRALFSVVADSVIEYQFFPGNRLPTKKRAGQFDWTMGPGVAALGQGSGCGYGLFLLTEDQFGSTGRKMLQIVALMARVPVTSGVHKGYAGLVDLRTGELIWLNADRQMGGDVRTADGAAKRVAQLLEGFPGAVPVPAGSGQ
ncbi:hypothetical protein [Sphingomonas abaci]|uniref:Uncharacterized protein n=1 Tax=Sphingomonas abaci TaxID=237611 RepID=A0A7W7AMT8_9SPHN|nr:hypothetical protein [Sphingomonas abaci]